MANSDPSRDELAQSFLIRLWQERPNVWRGTVRHVQGEGQKSFVRLEQAYRFIEQQIGGKERKPSAAVPSAPRWAWPELGRRQLAFAWAAMGLVVFVSVALVLVNGGAAGSLSGAAVGAGPGMETLLAFLAGLVVGGVAAWLWFGFKR